MGLPTIDASIVSRNTRKRNLITWAAPPHPSKQDTTPTLSPSSLRDELEAALSSCRSILLEEKLTQTDCDTLLAKCIALDEWNLVLEVLEIMKNAGFSQVQTTHAASLRACAVANNPAAANQVLAAMKLAKINPTMDDYAVIIQTMCKGKDFWWKTALTLRQEAATAMMGQDLPIAAYEALVEALVRENEWKEVVRLVRSMESSYKNNATSRLLVNATKPSLKIYRQAIECCAAVGQTDLASQILLSSVESIVPTTGMFETVITSFCQALQWRRALGLLDCMERLGVPKSLRLYNALLTSCARAQEPAPAKALLVRMRQRDKIRPNIASFNSIMSACVGASHWKDALSILDQVHREPDVTPDLYTYTNAIRACAKGRQASQALTLLQVVKDKGFKIDAYCYTAAIEACDWRKALELLQEMQDNGVSPTEVTYSMVIKSCGAGGQWVKALELLDIMRGQGMMPNLFVYNAAITTIAKAAKRLNKGRESTTNGKMYEEINRLLQQMERYKIEPDGFTYASAISCCGSEGLWEEAMSLLNKMQQGGPKTQPNKVAYTAAISSCANANQAVNALKLFEQMKEQGLSLDIVVYNALFAALRAGRRSDEAFRLWNELMRGKNQTTIEAKTMVMAPYKLQPDIITLTDAIGAVASNGSFDRVDKIFKEAVDLGLILRGDSLDSLWEFDLSGLSFPVARAACRFVVTSLLKRIAKRVGDDDTVVEDLVFITGVGARHKLGLANTTSLRDYIQEILTNDFRPSLNSTIPTRAKGTILIDKDELRSWIRRQKQ